MSGAVAKDTVLKIIGSVLEKLDRQDSFTRENFAQELHQELQGLRKLILTMRQDLASTGAGDIKATHIPVATDELDAVVEATAEATGTIMDACERIEVFTNASGNDALNKAVLGEITKIYEACSFQDITGQRIKKVVGALKQIETKVDDLIVLLDNGVLAPQQDNNAPARASSANAQKTMDGGLLNGPQLPQNAISQADIDKLLEEFG